MNASRPLTEYQISTLQVLGEYRFLIVPQIARLVAPGRKHFPKYFSAHVLPGLDTEYKPLLGRIRYPVSRQYGKRHELFYLTEHGAVALSEVCPHEVGSYRTAEPRHAIERDFAHRVAYIDACIGFREWVAAREGARLLKFVDYFDRIAVGLHPGAARRGFVSKTRVHIAADRFIDPDGVALYSDGGRRRLFAIEMHMEQPPGKTIEQLEGHAEALERGTLPDLYDCAESNRVLSVHENPDTMRKVMERLRDIPRLAPYLPAYLFAALDDVRADFAGAWRKIDGTPSRAFL